MKKILAVMAVVLLVFSFNIYSDDFAGESMAIGVGARPLGMGGTFVAIANDASTSYWNPAGLVNIYGVEVSSVKLTKINDLDTKYTYVNLVYNVGPQIGAFGLGWLRQSIGEIQITGIETPLGEQPKPVLLGVEENSDNTFYLAYGRELAPGFAMGTSIKILMGNYPATIIEDGEWKEGEVNYSGFGLDIGMHVNAGKFMKDLKGLTLGVNIQDVYTGLTWESPGGDANMFEGGSENVPVNIKPGIAYTIPIDTFEVVASLDLDTKYQMIIHAGGEIWWNKMIAIRGGIKNYGEITSVDQNIQQESDWSMGASIRWFFIGLDYAYVNNELTPVQYLSIIGKF